MIITASIYFLFFLKYIFKVGCASTLSAASHKQKAVVFLMQSVIPITPAGALGSNEVPPLLSVAIWLSLSLCSVRKIDFYLLLWNNDEISPFFSLPSDVNFKVAFESEEMPWCIHSFVDPFWSDGGELPSSRPPSIWYYSVYLKKKKKNSMQISNLSLAATFPLDMTLAVKA